MSDSRIDENEGGCINVVKEILIFRLLGEIFDLSILFCS